VTTIAATVVYAIATHSQFDGSSLAVRSLSLEQEALGSIKYRQEH
jgi:hypothetical protein